MSQLKQPVKNKGANNMTHAERNKTIWKIVIFSVLVTALAFISPLLGGSPSSPGLGFIMWGTAPLLVAVLMRLVTRDWSDAGLWPALRKNAKWYLFIILACPVIVVLTLLFGAAVSASTLSEFSMASYLQMVLPGLAMFFIFAIFEEFGWRGYLVPKLDAIGINSFIGAAIIAVVWATWHLPYMRELTWTYNTSQDLVTFIPRFYLMMFAYSILYYEIRLITGSIWPAVLLHALTNAIQHPLDAEFMTITTGQEYLVSFSGLFMMVLVGLLGIALNRWRMRKTEPSESFA
jgi:membrane protease YdiL (CAAX protease family)